MPFLGWLFLFGLVVGTGQAVLVWWRLTGLDAALSWAAASFGGWAAGGIVSSLVDSLGASQGLFLAFPRVVLGLGQALALVALAHRQTGFWVAVSIGLAWVLATAIGGTLFSALVELTNRTGVHDSLEHMIGVPAGAVVRSMLFTALLYGVPTGVVLAWFGHRRWRAISNDR